MQKLCGGTCVLLALCLRAGPVGAQSASTPTSGPSASGSARPKVLAPAASAAPAPVAGKAKGAVRSRLTDPASASASASEPISFVSTHFGRPAAERLLASESEEDRLRGLLRLSALHDRAAIERIAQLIDTTSSIVGEVSALLIATRAMAGFVELESVRKVLVRLLSIDAMRSPGLDLVRDTAALVLAESGSVKAVDALVRSVRAGGPAGVAARAALLAYPPTSFSGLLLPGEAPSPAQCELLGELGDLRAVAPLQGILLSSPAPRLDLQRAAAVALARLGQTVQVAVARTWLASPNPSEREAGTRVLLATRPEEYGPVISRLFEDSDARDLAIQFAADGRRDNLAIRLESALAKLDLAKVNGASPLGAIFGALSTAGDPASQVLERMLLDPRWQADAARSLAILPGLAARHVLERALQKPETRRLALRASAIRKLLLNDLTSGQAAVLTELEKSSDSADRAASAWSRSMMTGGAVVSLLHSADRAVVAAAAKTLLIAPPDAVTYAAARLSHEPDPDLRTALGLALARSAEAASLVSTAQLWALVDDGGSLAPLALVVAGTRERPESKHRLDEWLDAPNALLRAHAASALAWSPEPDSAARLADRWQFEVEAPVRVALVRALSARREPQRLAALRAAARLDPDPVAREIARTALADGKVEPAWPVETRCASRPTFGPNEVAWISTPNRVAPPPLPGTAEPDRARPSTSAGKDTGLWSLVVDAWTVALPVVLDPDFIAVVPGVRRPDSRSAFALASWLPAYKAQEHDGVQRESDPADADGN